MFHNRQGWGEELPLVNPVFITVTTFVFPENLAQEIAELDALLDGPDWRRFVLGSLRLALKRVEQPPPELTDEAVAIALKTIPS
jgi:hypothetical protein